MNKQTAVIICNWNKKEDVLACIDSVFRSNYKEFDLICVDNGSTDGSVKAIQSLRAPIHIISLQENVGGAGGFNAGLEYAMQGSYEYIVLLDNDVIVDETAIASLVSAMELHDELGILGAKIYLAGTENHLQEFGSYIDWDNFNIKPLNQGAKDNNQLPSLLECDYVPACALIVRSDAIRKVGMMDAQYFIYWDDIEWGYRMKQAGYRVMVTSQAKVWHKMGAAERKNTFATYYFWRNRIHFFVNHISENSVEQFCEKLLNEILLALFFSQYNKQQSLVFTIVNAIMDGLSVTRGQASTNKIFEREIKQDALNVWLQQMNQPLVSFVNCTSNTPDDVVASLLSRKYRDYSFVQHEKGCIYMVDHISEYTGPYCDDYVIVDKYFNVISSIEEFQHINDFKTWYNLSYRMYEPLLKLKIRNIKEKKTFDSWSWGEMK